VNVGVVPLPGEEESCGGEVELVGDEAAAAARSAACFSKSSARFLRTRLGTNLDQGQSELINIKILMKKE
jgi:hypothetical protein